jgi:hypothetical protein
METKEQKLKNSRRSKVQNDYDSAVADNNVKFLEGVESVSEFYTYPNQKEDAFNICNEIYNNNRRVISISKRVKVGADGLIIEIAKNLGTHIDDNFVKSPNDMLILTGMSNISWEEQMIEKCPLFLKDKIFHHGKLNKSKKNLRKMKNAVIFIDEYDTATGEGQQLHNLLKDENLLDVDFLTENNIIFIFISATFLKQLYTLYKWGDLHINYVMTVPPNYIGHGDFFELEMAKEWYSLNNQNNCEKWIKEDIIENYGNDFRIHVVASSLTTVNHIIKACNNNNIDFRNHNSDDRIPLNELSELFNTPLKKHFVLILKKFYSRADFIPNKWKLKIGASMALFVPGKINVNNLIQAFIGRMCGYWKNEFIENDHKTGPHRTSMEAIKNYEQTIINPFGNNSYSAPGFNKKNGIIKSLKPILFSPHNIKNLEEVDLPIVEGDLEYFIEHEVFETQNEARLYAWHNFAKEIKISNGVAPKTFTEKFDGNNPTVEYILNRKWGLNEKSVCRLIPTDLNKWCLYWKNV